MKICLLFLLKVIQIILVKCLAKLSLQSHKFYLMLINFDMWNVMFTALSVAFLNCNQFINKLIKCLTYSGRGWIQRFSSYYFKRSLNRADRPLIAKLPSIETDDSHTPILFQILHVLIFFKNVFASWWRLSRLQSPDISSKVNRRWTISVSAQYSGTLHCQNKLNNQFFFN